MVEYVRQPTAASAPTRIKSLSAHSRAGDRTSFSVLILAAMGPVSYAVSRLIDGARRVPDADNGYRWETTGNAAGVAFYLALAIAAAVLISNNFDQPFKNVRFSCGLGLLIWTLWLGLSQLLRPVDTRQLLDLFVIVLLALSAFRNPPSERLFYLLGRLLVVTLGATWVFRAFEPGRSASLCRSDKCGIGGELLNSFFPSENTLAIYLLLLLPTAAYLGRLAWPVYFATILTVAATGSRTAAVAGVLAGVAVFYLRRKAISASPQAMRIPLVLRLLPFLFFAGSGYLYYTVSGQGFTDRGLIWQAVQSQNSGLSALIGFGPRTLQNAFETTSYLAFLPNQEHGEYPHVLARTGIIGVGIFGVALLSLLAKRNYEGTQLTTFWILTVTAGLFITEVSWFASLRDGNIWIIVLCVGGLASMTPSERRPRGSTDSAGQRLRISSSKTNLQEIRANRQIRRYREMVHKAGQQA